MSGSRRIASMTSSVVSGEKLQKDVPGRTRLNVGGGASLVPQLSNPGNFISKELVERFNIEGRARRYASTGK